MLRAAIPIMKMMKMMAMILMMMLIVFHRTCYLRLFMLIVFHRTCWDSRWDSRWEGFALGGFRTCTNCGESCRRCHYRSCCTCRYRRLGSPQIDFGSRIQEALHAANFLVPFVYITGNQMDAALSSRPSWFISYDEAVDQVNGGPA